MPENAGATQLVHDRPGRERKRSARRFLVGALVVIAAAELVARLLGRGDPLRTDALSAFVVAAALASFSAWTARRAHEEAHPVAAFLVVFLFLFLLRRSTDWVQGIL